MPLSRTVLERQLQLAKSVLADRVKALEAAGVDAATFKTDPKWREMNADVKQINKRLLSLGLTEANDVAVKQRKEEKLAGTAVEE